MKKIFFFICASYMILITMCASSGTNKVFKNKNNIDIQLIKNQPNSKLTEIKNNQPINNLLQKIPTDFIPNKLATPMEKSQEIDSVDLNTPISPHKEFKMQDFQDHVNPTAEHISTIYNKVTDEFTEKINNILKKFIKKSCIIMIKTRIPLISQVSLADIFMESIQHFLLKFSGISENTSTQSNKSIDTLKNQIQYIAQQIEYYNATTIYKKPELMLLFMEYMHQFLKENNLISFSPAMFIRLDQVLILATTCCNIFKNQNMILSSSNAPAQIVDFFQIPIDNTTHLQNLKFNEDLMHAIYNTKGSIDTILQTWKNFTQTDLYQIPSNRQYAAFLTFLLLFENTMVASAIIIDQTSTLYKVTNPIPVIINIV